MGESKNKSCLGRTLVSITEGIIIEILWMEYLVIILIMQKDTQHSQIKEINVTNKIKILVAEVTQIDHLYLWNSKKISSRWISITTLIWILTECSRNKWKIVKT